MRPSPSVVSASTLCWLARSMAERKISTFCAASGLPSYCTVKSNFSPANRSAGCVTGTISRPLPEGASAARLGLPTVM